MILSFSSLPQESKSNLCRKEKGHVNRVHQVNSGVEAELNRLCVEASLDGVHTRREGERGQTVDFLLVGFCLRIKDSQSELMLLLLLLLLNRGL